MSRLRGGHCNYKTAHILFDNHVSFPSLTLLPPPLHPPAKTVIATPPVDAMVQEGNGASFQCEIIADPNLSTNPELYWLKDGTRLEAASVCIQTFHSLLKDNLPHNTCQIYVKPHRKNAQMTVEFLMRRH